MVEELVAVRTVSLMSDEEPSSGECSLCMVPNGILPFSW